MTLTARVSMFFLGWLALALAGFAFAIFLFARADLHRQVDDRLAGTLDTLVAAAETNESGVEWEANERIVPRFDNELGNVQWLVLNPAGRAIDRSVGATADWLLAIPDGRAIDPTGSPWQIGRRHIEMLRTEGGRPTTQLPPGASDGAMKYDSLEVVAAVLVEPIRTKLNRLAAWLAGLTIGIWLFAAVVGQWLCRRTLAPVSEMAIAARELSPSDPGERLDVRRTGDELEDLGRAFNGALERLEEAFARQARFTGDAAHQLRTPLAAMLGQVEVALRRDRDAANYRETLKSVADEIRHVSRLTEAMLFLARADAEAELPNLAMIDLVNWISEHVKQWRMAHPNTRVELLLQDSPTSVWAHPELFAQLVDNLLDNAVKYGPPAGPIQIRLQSHGAATELTFEDRGLGIATEDLPNLFDRFFRSASARAAGIRGIGLGLSVARRIADAMKAQLTVESEPGHGSRFGIKFLTQESALPIKSAG